MISSEMLYKMVYETDKCIISWEIKSLKDFDKPHDMYHKYLNIEVLGEHTYLVKTYIRLHIEWIWMMLGWGGYTNYNNFNLPQVWDEVNYLVESEDFTLISDEYEDWFFRLTSGEILEQEVNACEIEKSDDIFYIWFIWVGIFLLIIFLILLYKRISKK